MRDNNYDQYPVSHESLWLEYSAQKTTFKLWSPTAQKVKVNFYASGQHGKPYQEVNLVKKKNGVWSFAIHEDLSGKYYTFQVMINHTWMNETPGIYAQAVGVNGKRAMVLDHNKTNPKGWFSDSGPTLHKPNEAIIYELHIRDITSSPSASNSKSGKYLGLVEKKTSIPQGLSTGIDHIKELGITHVHLLPTYDYHSIDETRPDSAQYNWGYDPQNYNVPEGSFSSDPFNAAVRIKEFKAMVKAFHDHGIGVILDVVYNHTGKTEESNFNQEVPGYYYRKSADGSWSNASACGNETASDHPMMRKFIKESVLYWAKEYHIDGFRFDLMGIHDIHSMNEIAEALKTVNPSIFIYGEGWTAGDSPLPAEERAIKKNVWKMPQISAFSDDLRDGLKGSVFDDMSLGFVNGAANMEESIKFGVVGSIDHPQINYSAVKYSDTAWAKEPWQAVSYVSCHDNHTLFDKLTISRRQASLKEIKSMHMLANAIVLTSQGISFLHAGVEMMRTKSGEHNSYNLPDSINSIDWNWKHQHRDIFDYHRALINLRKAHPAFHMPTARMVRKHLKFVNVPEGIVSYTIYDGANGDHWKRILVVYNARTETYEQELTETWWLAVIEDRVDINGIGQIKNKVKVPPISMLVAFQKSLNHEIAIEEKH